MYFPLKYCDAPLFCLGVGRTYGYGGAVGVDDLTLLLTLALFRIFGCHIISLAISYAWDFALTNVLFLGLYLLIFNL